MVAEEEQKNEMVETENQKEQLDIEIADVDEKIREKERLVKEVELKNEIQEGVVIMGKGELKKRERRRVEKRNKEDEMKMLNLEMMVDEKNDKIAQLYGQKEGLEENARLVEQYLENIMRS